MDNSTDSKQELELTFHQERMRYLFDGKVKVYLSGIITATFFLFIVKENNNLYYLGTWLFAFFAISIARMILIKTYQLKLDNSETINPIKWENYYFSLSLLSGLNWGIAGLLFCINSEVQQSLVAICLIIGVCTASVIGNASSLKTVYSFVLSMLVPLFIVCVRLDSPYNYHLAFLDILLLVNLLISCKKINDQIVNTIKLKLYKSELATELKDANDKLFEAQQQVIQSSKLAAVGEMASGIAHEINNPLTYLSGNLRLIDTLIQSKPDSDKIPKLIESCEVGIERISKIIRGLKVLSRDGSNDDFEVIPLKIVIEDVENLIKQRIMSKGVDYFLVNEVDNVKIMGKRVQLGQIILNLVTNSLHALEGKKDCWVKLECKRINSNISIRVIDSGSGISEDKIEKIFNPFFTTKEVGKGTGLGLSISKSIAKHHNGSLRYEKHEGNTSFVLEIPECKKDKSAA